MKKFITKNGQLLVSDVWRDILYLIDKMCTEDSESMISSKPRN